MTSNQNLAKLLSDCSLSLRVASASLVDAAPPATTAVNVDKPEQRSNVKQWATKLLNEPARHELYHGKAVRFHLVAEMAHRDESDSSQSTLTALLRAYEEAKLSVTATCVTAAASIPKAGRLPRRESLGLGIAGQSFFATMAAVQAAAEANVGGKQSPRSGDECKEDGFWATEIEGKQLAIWRFSTQLASDEVSASTASIFAQFRYSGGADTDKSASASAQLANDADDYLYDDDFDTVDLLGAADSSTSRKPEARPEARGANASSGQADSTAATVRHNAQLMLALASPVNVELRVIPSPTGDGALLAVEVSSAGRQRCDLLDIDARASDRLSTGEKSHRLAFDVKPYRLPGGQASTTPSVEKPTVLAGPNSRHVHLFSITRSPFAPSADKNLSIKGSSLGGGSPSVPLEVMTSPSQRFASRFGDPELSAGDSTRRARTTSIDDIAKLAVVVKTTSRVYEPGSNLPTTGFVDSEWRCDFDSSILSARDSQPIRPTKHSNSGASALAAGPSASAETRQHLRHSAHAAAITALSSRIASSRAKSTETAALPTPQALAGSERYTRKALAALQPSELSLDRPTAYPIIGREASAAALPPRQEHAASVPKRFFSLPHGGTPITSLAAASASSANILPVRTETPPPIVVAKRASVPDAVSSDVAPVRPQAAHRKSWISGLRRATPSDPVDAAAISPGASEPLEANRNLPRPPTSWDTLDTSSAPPPTENANEPIEAGEEGKVLVSVSLVPLRKPRRRRSPPMLDLSVNGLGPKAVSPSAPSSLSPLPPHRTTFAFPPASPISPTQPSPTSGRNFQPRRAEASPSSGPASDGTESSAREEIMRAPRINVLDVFLVDVFVLNQTNQIKHYAVRAPDGCLPSAGAGGAAAIIALETDVEVGPLEPKSCAACALRFFAVRTGSHVLEQLRLVDLTDGTETVLERPVTVVVE